MGRNRQRWEKIFSFAGLIDYEWLYRRRGFNAAAREMVLFGRGPVGLPFGGLAMAGVFLLIAVMGAAASALARG